MNEDQNQPKVYQEVPLDRLVYALQEIDLLPRAQCWVLASPGGAIYSGTVEQLLPVLLREHASGPALDLLNALVRGF